MALAFTAGLEYLWQSQAAFRDTVTRTMVPRFLALTGEARQAVEAHLSR